MSSHDEGGQERDICVLPVYAVSEDAAATILDLAATMGVDYLIIGTSQRSTLAHLLGGSVVTKSPRNYPRRFAL